MGRSDRLSLQRKLDCSSRITSNSVSPILFVLHSVQFNPVSQSCPTLCNPMNLSMPGLPVHHQLLEFTQIHVHRVSDTIQPSHPLSSLLLLPPIPLTIRVFSNESTLRMRWPKYWNFSVRIIPSKEIPGLISFRMDWLDLLAVQGTLRSLLQHRSSKASILQCSAFCMGTCKRNRWTVNCLWSCILSFTKIYK